MRDIVICSMPLLNDSGEQDAEQVFKAAEDDPILKESLQVYLGKLEDTEIFEIRHNIAATSKGYICAFYADLLTKIG